VFAFARVRDEEAALVVTPRLVGSLMPDSRTAPLGPQIWRDTWIALPDDLPATAYRNVLSGEELPSAKIDGRPVLLLSQVLNDCPVGLLEPVR
jgi:maltooligosyltrehalose synthase